MKPKPFVELNLTNKTGVKARHNSGSHESSTHASSSNFATLVKLESEDSVAARAIPLDSSSCLVVTHGEDPWCNEAAHRCTYTKGWCVKLEESSSSEQRGGRSEVQKGVHVGDAK